MKQISAGRPLPSLLIWVLATALLIGGCASAPAPIEDAPAPATAAEEPAETSPPLPELPLTADLLYDLMVGEISAQRGVLGLSASRYLEAAEATRDPRIARRATHIALYSRDYDRALEAAHIWVDTDPASIQARQSLCTLLLRSDRDAEVLAQLRELIQLGATHDGDGYRLVANVLSSEQNADQVIALMAQLVAEDPQNPQALLAQAELAHSLGRHESALDQVNALLKTHPDLAGAWLLRAKIEHVRGDIDASLASMEEALRLRPDDHNLRLAYARTLIDSRHLDKAREQFRILEKVHPDRADMIYALGLLAQQADDRDEARRQFQRLIKLNERRDEAAYALGQLEERAGNIEEAINWYQQVDSEEYAFEAGLRVALLIARTRGLEQALIHLQGLPIYEEDDLLRRFVVEGELYRTQGRYDQAMAVYSRGLESFPNHPDLLYARAMTAEKAGQPDRLEADLRLILAADPDNVQALNALGYTLADTTDRLNEAYDLIRRALELNADDPAILDSMGWVLYRMGRAEDGLGYLQKAAARSTDGEIAAHLGEVLWSLDRKDEARDIWQRALKRSPNSPVLRDTLKRFSR